MPARYKSRQRALQILYQLDLRGNDIDGAIQAYYLSLYSEEGPETSTDIFMEELARGTSEKLDQLDGIITQHSANWRVERMPSVDRNIIRMAVYEMLEVGTPAPVVIDQAIELARRFSGEESVGFINGVLDAIRREKAA
jgi:N utilization substance protein B